jgi:hypothetical protein
MAKYYPEDVDEVLKKASIMKKKNHMDAAIDMLRLAYEIIIEINGMYSHTTYLKLPQYLEAANRKDEAWQEFNKLLNEGYPNRTVNPGIIATENSVIYDKMRLFLQRDDKKKLAIKYEIYSHLSWMCGLYLLDRKSELEGTTSDETIRYRINSVVKKAELNSVAEKLVSLVNEQITKLPNIDFNQVGARVDEITGN